MPERIRIVEAIWDSIADTPEALELSEEQKAGLDRRLETLEKESQRRLYWVRGTRSHLAGEMSHRLIVRPEAERDIAEAAEWYDQQRAGLSLRFRAALDGMFASIEENPLLHAQVYLRRRLGADPSRLRGAR